MEYNAEEGEAVVPSSHSLQADLATGWKPKLKVIGPMPLNFDNPQLDGAIKFVLSSDTSLQSVVYLGPRPINTFQMHEICAKKYRYKYLHLVNSDFGHLKSYFHKFYGQFEPASKRQFTGMNPSIRKKTIVFDSSFESGNLDCAIQLREHEYDLILRIDSNTAGHILWYYFKVANKEETKCTVKLNIINLRRMKSAYERGMRPYIKRKDQPWLQGGQNVTLSDDRIKYVKQNLIISSLANDHTDADPSIFRKLSFEVDLDGNEEIQLAYCIPYTYSQLMTDLKTYRRIAAADKSIRLDIDCTNESLSGLQIPVIKITEDSQQTEKKKYCVLCVARQHPGESNSSHVTKGLISTLLSSDPEVKRIRQHCNFVIIPMLNPDGVVMGNFRTSLFGKDLNRLFKTSDCSLIPQVYFSRELMLDISKAHKNRFIMFLDIHGHSTRRNSFCFGPGILDTHMVNDIRYFPKIIASKTEIFRYPSCSFRIANDKKTTARALFTKFAGLCYTIESSNWSYFSQGVIYEFDAERWFSVGQALGNSLKEFINEKIDNRKMKYLEKTEHKPTLKKQAKNSKSIIIAKDKSIDKYHDRPRKSSKSKKTEGEAELDRGKLPPFQQIIEREDENESDKMSQNGMDTDSEGEDMEKGKFKNYISAASKMIIEFEKAYYGDNYKKEMSRPKGSQSSALRQNTFLFKEKKKIEVLACLRKKEAPVLEFKEENFVKKIYLQKKISEHIKISKKETLGTIDQAATIPFERLKSKSSMKKMQYNVMRHQEEEDAQPQPTQLIHFSDRGLKDSKQLNEVYKLEKSKSMVKANDSKFMRFDKIESSKQLAGKMIHMGRQVLPGMRLKINNIHSEAIPSTSPTKKEKQVPSPTLPKIPKHSISDDSDFLKLEKMEKESPSSMLRNEVRLNKINMLTSTPYCDRISELFENESEKYTHFTVLKMNKVSKQPTYR